MRNPATELSSSARSLPTKYVTPFVLAALANIIWGSSFLASKWSLHDLGPFTASALRFVLALLFLWVLQKPFRYKLTWPKRRESWMRILWIGLAGFGLLYPLQLAGLKIIPSGLSAAIMLTSPLFLVVFNFFFRKERASTEKWAAVVLGMFGGLLILSSKDLIGNTNQSELLVGSLLTFGASMCLAISVVLTKRVTESPEKINAATLTFLSMFFGLTIIAPCSAYEIYRFPLLALPTLTTWLSLIYLALVCSVVGFVIWNRAIAEASPSAIASTMHLKTPVAIVVGILVAGEFLSPQILIGTAIVGFAVWLSQKQWRFSFAQNRNYLSFQPDLVVEVTKVCDQACKGCYAPNVLLNKATVASENLYLDPESLEKILASLDKRGLAETTFAIRGGEPSLHPQLPAILKTIGRISSKTYLETHARWILTTLTKNGNATQDILAACRENQIKIKISFDKMHSLNVSDLQKITSRLADAKIDFALAITASDEEDFLSVRNLCTWVPNNKINFQKKATSASELIEPRIGVVGVNGDLKKHLASKWKTTTKQSPALGTT